MNSHWAVEAVLEGGALQPSVTLARRGKEAILVDTGYQRQEEQLVRELERRGVNVDSVTHVMNTHLHFDHSHNNSLFQKARILCSQQEYEWMTGLCDQMLKETVALADIYAYYPELRTLENGPKPIWTMVKLVQKFWRTGRLGRNDQFRWLEGHPLPDGIHALPTPGHVPHHISFIFDTAAGAVLVAGDAVITRGGEDGDIRTFPPTNRARYTETKKTLAAFAGTIIPGHDAPFAGAP
jgi:glyoxylase-like metal-dependent hydrolase (beta-lactamase superfamily II)